MYVNSSTQIKGAVVCVCLRAFFPNKLQVTKLWCLTTACLLGENVDGVVIFHVQAGRRVGLVNWRAVKSKSNLVDIQALAIAVSIHQLLQLRILFDLELHNGSILAADLQVDVLAGAF